MYPDLLESQLATVRDAFNYCLCVMMVEAGKMELVETVPGEEGAICVFKSAIGEEFALQRPAMSQEEDAKVTELMRSILADEDLNVSISQCKSRLSSVPNVSTPNC